MWKDSNFHKTVLKTVASCRLGYTRRLNAEFGMMSAEWMVVLIPHFAFRVPHSNWWTERDSNPYRKFAGLPCCQLHHQPERKIGTDGEIRTHIILFLRQAPLPIGLRRRKNGLGGRIQTCENLLPGQARIVICGTPRKKMASEKGFEPLFPDSKSGVLAGWTTPK